MNVLSNEPLHLSLLHYRVCLHHHQCNNICFCCISSTVHYCCLCLLMAYVICICRLREEVNDQIRALEELKAMALTYGHDISRPAQDAQEAVQWLYYGYLGSGGQ